MRKIPSLFLRDFSTDDRPLTRDVNPLCAWVMNGEGVATEKVDGAACMVRGRVLFKRYDAKPGRTPPPGFEPCGEPDPETGHNPGWVPCDAANPADKWYLVALAHWLDQAEVRTIADGTYEAVGPHFQGNPHRLVRDCLVRHGCGLGGIVDVTSVPRDFDGLRAWFEAHEVEGIVWHHPDGRMAKIKRRDFGLPWPVKGRR